jgi:2-C-methyl-D-erythritol 4-phosphate cytidylyltransferase
MIIPAGGSGKRFGGELPKQFLDLAGVPIIIRTLQRVMSFEFIDQFIIAVHSDFKQLLEQQMQKFAIDQSKIVLVDGGLERANSIDNAMAVIPESPAVGVSETGEQSAAGDAATESVGGEDDIIMIHDAVRPFIEKEVAWECVKAAQKHGASNAAVPAADTMLHSVDGQLVDKIPERSHLFHGQTPDVIRLKDFRRAMEILTPEQKQINMGTVGIVVNAGIKVKIVPSLASNFKITTPEQIVLAEAIVQAQGANNRRDANIAGLESTCSSKSGVGVDGNANVVVAEPVYPPKSGAGARAGGVSDRGDSE